MKKVFLIVAVMAGWSAMALAAAPGTLTSVQAVRSLTNAQAAHGLPVEFEGTVSFYRDYERILFVYEDGVAIYVGYPTPLKLAPGDRVLVKGKTQKSFSPIVSADSVTVVGHGVVPKPEKTTYDELIQAEADCKLVTLHAILRAADQVMSVTPPHTFMRLQLIMDGGYLNADVSSENPGDFDGLLDAEVDITGIASERFDSKMHMTGINLQVQSISDVKVTKLASSRPSGLPFTPMDKVVKAAHFFDTTQRVRVRGTITYFLKGSAVVLQDGDKSIWINTLTEAPLRIGDAADATGFPANRNGFTELMRGEVFDTAIPAPIKPLPVTLATLSMTGFDSPGHHNDLVSIEGKVVTEVREDAQDELVLSAEGKLFSAIYRHPGGAVSGGNSIPIGSKVRVTGICIQESSDPFAAQIPFRILMRSSNDVLILENPSLVNIRNLLIAVGLLLAVAILAGVRGWLLERKVRQKTAALAVSIEAEAETQRRSALLEQKRSQILEHINGTEPLPGILSEIVAMASFTLNGTPCWCELPDGLQVGNCPKGPRGLRICEVKIDARAGLPLGAIYAGLDEDSTPSAQEMEALHNGARLATLAIETRKLYSDLRRRSEFDLLTDIPNRFAMERFMDLQIEEARCGTARFGLIFIDLDKFKPINDTFGHHVGDLYLQEVAKRLSSQLLGGDMVARLGGDEFTALVSLKHGRFDLDRIIERLEHCFDDPFVIDGNVIHGEASIGFALYPQDGTSRDELLNAADAAMYETKHGKRAQAAERGTDARAEKPRNLARAAARD